MVLRHPGFPVTRVVVGVNGSAGSVAALHWAAAEACRCKAMLRIVSAWEEPDQPGPSWAVHPAQIAAGRLQKALARVLSRQHYPRRIACAALSGTSGEALLRAAGDADLLVLGATGAAAMQVPGSTGRYCLQHGRGPLVFVPAAPGP